MKLMVWRRTATLLLLFCSLISCSLISPPAGHAQAMSDQATDIGWPRQIQQGGNTITIYQPQVERWDGNQLQSRAAVAVETPASAQPTYGVIWLSARTEVDKERRLVTLEDCRISTGTFPTAAQDYLSLLRQAIPPGPHTIALDRLQANLAVTQAEQKDQKQPLKSDPPRLFFSATPAILVLIDGPPALRQVAGTDLLRVINTRALLLLEQVTGQYYLYVTDRWLSASAIEGPWAAVDTPPAALETAKQAAIKSEQVDLLDNLEPQAKAVLQQGLVPTIDVSTTPAELIETQGKPDWTPIDGTQLLYVTNTMSTILMHVADQEDYVLISGRWFRSRSFAGPWENVSNAALPSDFAKIPENHPKGTALVSVAGTPQAREAVIANTIPQTATVTRSAATLSPRYDGEPKFKSIEGTPLQYAVNSPTPVIRVDANTYYAVENGVWFVATAPTGQWSVATTVPAVIYTIPPSSPLYYVTYVRVYGSTPEVVYAGYTPGYYGTYVAPEGVVVYGTGWYYPPYIGSVWIGPPVTYGFGAGFEWGAASGFMLGFASDAFWYPWWGPIGWGYRHAHVDIHDHRPFYHGNVYNRWGSRVAISHIGHTFAGHVGDTRFIGNARAGDLYAGHEGNVYRFQGGQWQRYGSQSWEPLESRNADQDRAHGVASLRPRAGTEGEGLRAHEEMGGRAGGMLSEHESVESLDREATARSLGESRWNDFRSGGGFNRGGFGENHLAGGGFGGGFGAFHGGGFHGGGFGGGHGGGHR
jgi:hypothetical protein